MDTRKIREDAIATARAWVAHKGADYAQARATRGSLPDRNDLRDLAQIVGHKPTKDELDIYRTAFKVAVWQAQYD